MIVCNSFLKSSPYAKIRSLSDNPQAVQIPLMCSPSASRKTHQEFILCLVLLIFSTKEEDLAEAWLTMWSFRELARNWVWGQVGADFDEEVLLEGPKLWLWFFLHSYGRPIPQCI